MRSAAKKNTRRPKSKNSSKKYFPKSSSINYFVKIVFINCISLALFSVFLNNGWSPISISEIKIEGNKNFDNERIIEVSGLLLPKPLLEVIPKRIETKLIKNLSLQAVSVRRQILPTKLIIEVLEREPVAYAQKIGSLGIENGMIDKKAEWIPIEWTIKDRPDIELLVTGWDENYKHLIAFILQRDKNLGSPLKSIYLSPTGEIVLKTEYFPSINLGSNHEQLLRQLKALAHLSKNLPASFIKQKQTTIDLTDLSKPELQTGALK